MSGLRVVLAGGSGQVGNILARHFHESGNQVTVLSRSAPAALWKTVQWDGRSLGPWVSELDGADVLINLAGRSVNCRYTPENRCEIMGSRVYSTRVVGKAITQVDQPPKLWMNSSTATIYRHSIDREMDEETGELGGQEQGLPASWRFSIDVATNWEHELFSAQAPNTRKIALRISLVLSPHRKGIFDVLSGLVRRGLGGTVGSGSQYVSWIHDTDFVRTIDFLISHKEIDGVVNVTSPNPLPNREFMRRLRRAWRMPIGLPAPEWLLGIGTFLLRTEPELVLKSRRSVPGRLLASGFRFEFPEWGAAAKDLVRRRRDG